MELVTARLLVRRFGPTDLEAFVAHRIDPDVARFQTWGIPYSRAQAQELLRADAAIAPGQPGEWLQLASSAELAQFAAASLGTCTSPGALGKVRLR